MDGVGSFFVSEVIVYESVVSSGYLVNTSITEKNINWRQTRKESASESADIDCVVLHRCLVCPYFMYPYHVYYSRRLFLATAKAVSCYTSGFYT